MRILALADDLTGALETGAQLAAGGVPCVVLAGPPFEAESAAAVFNIETRHVSAAEAEHRVLEAVAGHSAAHVFLKTDSTLRGRIRESLHALKRRFPERDLVYVPAYPAMGRTVRGGVLYVHGVPLAGTAFARDPLNPVRDSSAAAIGEGLAEVRDGETEADLAAAAESLRGRNAIAAGTAGFVGHWMRTLPVARSRVTPWRIVAGDTLVVVGSRHPVARAQAASLQGHPGCRVHLLPTGLAGDPLDVAARCGQDVRRMLDERPAGTLIVVGGDTAAAILKALGCRVIRPNGELLPGVPVSRMEAGDFNPATPDGNAWFNPAAPEAEVAPRPGGAASPLRNGLTLITKAGGFGDENTLLRIMEKLK